MKITYNWLKENTLYSSHSFCFSQRQIRYLMFWFPDLRNEQGTELRAGWFKDLLGRDLTDLRATLYINAKYLSPEDTANQTQSRQWQMIEEEVRFAKEKFNCEPNIKRSILGKIIRFATIKDFYFDDNGDKMVVDFIYQDKPFRFTSTGTLFANFVLEYENKSCDVLGKNFKLELDKLANPDKYTESVQKKKVVIVRKKNS